MLIWMALVPTVAMAAQVVVTADRLLEQSEHLRADVASGERIGVPLYRLMVEMQAERTMTAARWAGTAVSEGDLRNRRAATDRAAAEFRRSSATAAAGSEQADRRLLAVAQGLDDLGAYRERADARSGNPDSTVAYYTSVITQMIRFYQDEFSHIEDGELDQESRVVVAMFSASEILAQEDTILAQAGPSRELTPSRFADFVNAVGAHSYLYDISIVPYLSGEGSEPYAQINGSDAWQTKSRIEHAVVSEHEDIGLRVKLPREVSGWQAAHKEWAAQWGALNADRARGLLAHADAKAAELEAEVAWLVAGSGGALLVVAGVVVFITRTVVRRLRGLHERTVTIAEKTLPDVVARLQRGQSVDADALPTAWGDQDEVGRISDAFARVVAVSVDGHRQLSDERDGFGMFAAGIASRTGNLVSRQLSLTEELQDTFGHDEALLAQLMRSDQLTVGMRRQIENLLILAGGEIPDPHTEPMRVADLLREAAAEVEDFRRIERQALDEISVEPRAISQISHLLAELLDNATRFSPPRSKVVIRAETVADGLSVEIEDRGPRVTPATYDEMNGRLHSAPPYAVLAKNAHRLGLFVVGHLADQLQARVMLRRSVYGGTSAVVILPNDVLVPTEREEPRESAPPVSEPQNPAPRLDERKPELVLHSQSGLPTRRSHERSKEGAHPVRSVAPDGEARPALPERVPQTHIAQELREPRAPEPAVGPSAATPEEVADAWADYEHGTQTVEQELRQEQP
ncbi:nitrate- and nitrite sensing domain-containing protein [Streptomyces sp. ISL-1]|uniref:sensor histidine kinase n=1 Tax=Streptomyces sp. ISL-1 TaxID=2817657 RepID=UPI0020354FB2|nr:nitrate- and nitrite sensing domain-containing protein [Streptomyces sp. ISL-1]